MIITVSMDIENADCSETSNTNLKTILTIFTFIFLAMIVIIDISSIVLSSIIINDNVDFYKNNNNIKV